MDGPWLLPPAVAVRAAFRAALSLAALFVAGVAGAQDDAPRAFDLFGDLSADAEPAAADTPAPPFDPPAGPDPEAAKAGAPQAEVPPAAAAAASSAEPPPPEPAPPEDPAASLPDAAELARRRGEAEAKEGVPDDLKASVLAELNAALAARRVLDEAYAAKTAAEAAAAAVEQTAADLQAALKEPLPKPELPPADATDADLAAAKVTAETELARLKEAKANRSPPPTLAERDAALTRLQAAADAAKKAAAAVRLAPPGDAPPVLTESKRLRAELDAAAARAKLAAGSAEKARAAAARARELPALRVAEEDRRIAAAEAHVSKLTDLLAARRQAEARKLTEGTGDGNVPEPLRPLAAEVAALSDEFTLQTNKLTSAAKVKLLTQAETDSVRARQGRLEDRVARQGLTDSVSRTLRKERATLPDLTALETALAARHVELEEANVADADHEDRLAALPEDDAKAATALMDAAGFAGEARDRVKPRAADLLERRRTLLTKLESNDDELIEALKALADAEAEHLAAAAAFEEFIDERVLWVRSGPALSPNLLRAEVPAIAGLAAPGAVGRFGESSLTALKAAVRRPAPLALGVGVVLVCGFIRLRLRRELTEFAAPVRRKGCRQFRPTAAALMATTLAACAGPAAAFGAAWLLGRGGAPPAADGGSVPESLTAAALSAGLYAVAAAWVPLSLLRAATRKDGLAAVHFGWPAATAHGVHREVKWFTAPVLTAALAAGLLGSADPQHAGGGWERVAFAICALLWAWLAHRLLRPHGPVWPGVRRATPDSPSLKIAVPLWLGFAAAGAAIAGLSVAGYHYSAGELARRSVNTVALLVAVVLLRGAAVRWVTVSRRSMLYATLLRKREEQAARQEASDVAGGGSPNGSGENAPVADDSPDAAALSLQTRSLVTVLAVAIGAVGLWFVWADLLPALRKLEDVTFPSWTVREEVLRPALDGGEPKMELERVPISLNDLLVAAFAAAVTFLASRHLPAVLELGAFRRLPLDAGGRYAFTRLVSYVVVVVGVLFTAGRLGFEWENVQWLVAALSVGLGFGLQEIVANFVCGLIILFERPVRVGDIVTVDDVTGVVSRIRIRATTITNWDRKEFIVPNKEFVTGRLLNWTLSDNTNRIVIEVGVAYGSDTGKALELLREACREQPLVMADPAPLATFEGFGDSTLNLILRCYLPNLDQRLPVTSELHAAIDRKFREAGIEIAFPQRDLHLRTVPAALAGGPSRVVPSHAPGEAATNGRLAPATGDPGRNGSHRPVLDDRALRV